MAAGLTMRRLVWFILFSAAPLAAGAPGVNLTPAMQRIGERWEQLAGAIAYDPAAALRGLPPLLAALDAVPADAALSAEMRRELAATRQALLALEPLLRAQRGEEAWAQRATIEGLCQQCHQGYRLAAIMRRMMEEYTQAADAFTRGDYERVIQAMHALQGQTEWFRRWIAADEVGFHQQAQRLLDLAGQAARAARVRDRPRTQQLLQQLIDSCPACHAAYRDTGRWRQLAKRY
jgi:cytochrome c556